MEAFEIEILRSPEIGAAIQRDVIPGLQFVQIAPLNTSFRGQDFDTVVSGACLRVPTRGFEGESLFDTPVVEGRRCGSTTSLLRNSHRASTEILWRRLSEILNAKDTTVSEHQGVA
jgi:hypothetical protein